MIAWVVGKYEVVIQRRGGTEDTLPVKNRVK